MNASSRTSRPPQFRRGGRTAVAVLASAALLAGCSSGDDKPAPATELTSPLEEFYNALYGTGQDTSEEDWAAQDRQVQESVAACMKEQGFDYTPDVQQTTSAVSSEDDGLEWGTVAYAEKYGYGITYWSDPDNPDNQMATTSATEYVDPNGDYVNAMSESEQTAYYAALWGDIQWNEEDWDPETGEWIGEGDNPYDSWENQGCYGAAQHEVYEGEDSLTELYDDPVYVEINETMSNIYTDVQSDQKVVELNASWAACMAEADYTFASPEEASNSLYDEWNTIQNEHYEELNAQYGSKELSLIHI